MHWSAAFQASSRAAFDTFNRGASPNEDNRSALINTPLQWGADGGEEFDNRFNGFRSAEQTVETVQFPNRSSGTPLKWGVNEMSSNCAGSEMRPFSLKTSVFARRPTGGLLSLRAKRNANVSCLPEP